MTGIVDDITQQDAEAQRQLVLTAICKPSRGNMTIKQLVEEVGSTQWGEVVMSLTLDDIRSVPLAKPKAPAAAEPVKKASNGVGKKVAAAAAAPKVAKAKGKAPKKKSEGKAEGKAEGKKRGKIDWEQMQKDIVALMKAQKEPVKTGLICKTLGCTPVQARKAIDFLLEEEKIEFEGEGRGRQYNLR